MEQEKVVAVGLTLIGFAQMIRHPIKSYNLLVHNVGWYD